MFREQLERIVESVEGGRAALLMGFDGISVEAYSREDAGEPDVKVVGMEFSFIFGQIRKAAEILEIGGVEELTIQAEKLIVVIRQLTEDYFAAVLLDHDGNFGKARFYLRIAAPKILAEF